MAAPDARPHNRRATVEKGSLDLTPTCIAFIDMPRMLREIVDDSLSKRPDVRLVDETQDGSSLVDAVDRSGAAVLIISAERIGPADVCRLLEQRPRVKVFAITSDGRDGCLYELRPNLVLVGDLSPTSLVQTVLHTEQADSETRTTTLKGR
jgi:DNA-binding NarL/FixJ family response regulator